jgi:hypothetical protein
MLGLDPSIYRRRKVKPRQFPTAADARVKPEHDVVEGSRWGSGACPANRQNVARGAILPLYARHIPDRSRLLTGDKG